MLRTTKILLIITVGLWGFTGAFQNILGWEGTIEAVKAATSMATIESGADSWQATSNPIIIWIGALFIMLSKAATGFMCGIGAMRMWQARGHDTVTFAASKELALVGCAIAMIMLFGGFIVVGENWFELWRSEAMRGPVLDSSFRYGGMIMLISLFVAAKND